MKTVPRKLIALIALLCALPALAATSGVTTQTAKTAAPVDVKLDGTTNQEAPGFTGAASNKDAFARANHQHKVSGVLSPANGGTGVNLEGIFCADYAFLTKTGAAFECKTPAGTALVGAAAPVAAQLAGGVDSAGNTAGLRTCDKALPIDVTLTGGALIAELLQAPAGKTVYTCGFFLLSNNAVSLGFVEGSTPGCATPVNVTGSSPVPAYGGFSMGLSGVAVPFTVNPNTYLCIQGNGAASVSGWLSYSFQ